jgi:hypothetical protein
LAAVEFLFRDLTAVTDFGQPTGGSLRPLPGLIGLAQLSQFLPSAAELLVSRRQPGLRLGDRLLLRFKPRL